MIPYFEAHKGNVGRFVDNTKPCSCFACAGDRKYLGETLQERRAALHLNEV